MSWHLGPLVGLDSETSGLSIENDRIVTACVALVDGTGKRKPDVLDVLINPGIEIPTAASNVHGWTTERIRSDPRAMAPRDGIELIADVLAKLLIEETDAPLVAHNLPFDLSFLDRECRRHELRTLEQRLGDRSLYAVDTLVLSKHFEPYRKRVSATQGPHQLKTCAQVYGIGWDDNAAHDANYDTLMACRVAWVMAKQNPRYAEMHLSVLHKLQVQWAAEQAESFRGYLKKQGKPYGDVSGEWPLVPFEGQAAIA